MSYIAIYALINVFGEKLKDLFEVLIISFAMCYLLIILYSNNDKRIIAFIRKYPNEKNINAFGKRFDER